MYLSYPFLLCAGSYRLYLSVCCLNFSWQPGPIRSRILTGLPYVGMAGYQAMCPGPFSTPYLSGRCRYTPGSTRTFGGSQRSRHSRYTPLLVYLVSPWSGVARPGTSCMAAVARDSCIQSGCWRRTIPARRPCWPLLPVVSRSRGWALRRLGARAKVDR